MIHFAVLLLAEACVFLFNFLVHNTFKAITKNIQFICKRNTHHVAKYYYNMHHRSKPYQHNNHNWYYECCNCSISWLDPTTIIIEHNY